MTEPDALERLQIIWNQIAATLLPAAAETAWGQPWTRGYFDSRGGRIGGARLQKWRVVLADGRTVGNELPEGVSVLMTDAYDLRDELFTEGDKWYGVVVSVYPNGRCEVVFDYDPACARKGFFDS